jgi:hypothetical protein
MKVDNVFILEAAVEDLNKGRSFYELQAPGIGDYFWDCLITDIESLIIYAGVHCKSSGFFRMYSKRFPYAVYYEIVDQAVYVAAVLPMKRDPAWISHKLEYR